MLQQQTWEGHIFYHTPTVVAMNKILGSHTMKNLICLQGLWILYHPGKEWTKPGKWRVKWIIQNMLSSSFGHQVLSIVPHVSLGGKPPKEVLCANVAYGKHTMLSLPSTLHFTPCFPKWWIAQERVLSTLPPLTMYCPLYSMFPKMVNYPTWFLVTLAMVSHGQDSRMDVLGASWYITIWLSKGEVKRRVTLNIWSNVAHIIHHQPTIMFLKIFNDG